LQGIYNDRDPDSFEAGVMCEREVSNICEIE